MRRSGILVPLRLMGALLEKTKLSPFNSATSQETAKNADLAKVSKP